MFCRLTLQFPISKTSNFHLWKINYLPPFIKDHASTKKGPQNGLNTGIQSYRKDSTEGKTEGKWPES